jgi:transposase
MMGTKARLLTPVMVRSLDELVPADHFYRHLDRVLNLAFVRDLDHGCYVADKGRPSVDPVVFFRLQLVMFFEGMRSERHLMRTVANRLSCGGGGLPAGTGAPDHRAGGDRGV